MIILGIETTCDETSAALVKDGSEILSQIIFCQEDLHAHYGGVYPEMAARRHIDVLHKAIDLACQKASIAPEKIDCIAVAYGPGLMGSLLIGLNAAKALSLGWKKPFIGVNHVEAHLYAAMMPLPSEKIHFPSLGLVVSGGHSFVVEISDYCTYRQIATTQDDAIGEAFDKVAVLLGYSYPGGAKVEKLALKGNPYAYPFKAATIKQAPLQFSFSGLKTAVLYALEKEKNLTDQKKADIAASFQRAAFDTILQKLDKIIPLKDYKSLFVGGGVSINQYFREKLLEKFSLPIYFPSKELCQDNAAMIAGLGYHKYAYQKKGDSLDLEPKPRIPFPLA